MEPVVVAHHILFNPIIPPPCIYRDYGGIKMFEEQLKLAYLAGIVDGEGTISIKTEHSTRPCTIYLTVANTNYEMIKIFEVEFGGKVRLRKWSENQIKRGSNNWKNCYEWILTKRQASNAVFKLYPYLKIKKRQAQLILRVARIRAAYPPALSRWNPKLHHKKLRVISKIKDVCKKLNKRGKN